jgi:hypothetical protein
MEATPRDKSLWFDRKTEREIMNILRETLDFNRPAASSFSGSDYLGGDAAWEYSGPTNDRPIAARLVRPMAYFESDASLDYTSSYYELPKKLEPMSDDDTAGFKASLRMVAESQ